jgi:3-methyladenine DNA glycosylase Tag
MEGPPPQYTAKTLDDYLEHLSKGVFQAGISWRVVDAKWASISKALRGFDVERVARMSDRDIDALVKDQRVIRSRPKIAAVVHNAGQLLALERAGGFKKHLRSFSEYEALATDLKRRFKFVGDSGVYHFLWTVKEPVPDWREWSRAHGKDWEAKVRASGDKRSPAPLLKTRPRAKARPSARAPRERPR